MSGSAAISSCKSYFVAASMVAVEALKDQGFARWNYTLRSLHHRFSNNLKAFSRSASSAAGCRAQMRKAATLKKTDNSIKKVMELDCYGPSTLRF